MATAGMKMSPVEPLLDVGGLGDDEAIAVAVHAQASQHQVAAGGLGDGVAVAGHFHQLAALDQPIQMLAQFPALVPVDSQLAHQLLEAGRLLRLAFDVVQDDAVGKHDSGSLGTGRRIAPPFYAQRNCILSRNGFPDRAFA